jgi:hypothetical protein
MRELLLAKMDTNQAGMKAVQEQTDTYQAKIDADSEASRENLNERMDANTKSMQEEIKSGQVEMKSTTGAIEEKMEAAIHSIWSEVEETIQHRMENAKSDVNLKTEGLCNELTKTQEDLQGAKAFFDTQKNDLRETIQHKGVPQILTHLVQGQDTKFNKQPIKTLWKQRWRLPDLNSSHSWKKSWPGPRGKRNRSLCKRSTAAKVRRNYVVGRVPVPV